MTTIAYKDGILAADSQVTFGNVKATSDPKIKELPNGIIIALAGNNDKIMVALQFFSREDWEEKLNEAPDFKKGFEAILVSKGRVYTAQNNCVPWPLVHPFHAAGSGWQIASAGMHMGMSAEEAVKLASELDIYTNNKVQVVNVQNLLTQAETKRAGRTPRRKAVPQA